MLVRALRTQGFVSLDSICYLDAPLKHSMQRMIEARVERKHLLSVALDGADKLNHWVGSRGVRGAWRSPEVNAS